ncbi:MAG: hypothetical protein AAFW46_17855 [Pseudomonadota bacterium]
MAYKRSPFRALPERKPQLVFFPKYVFPLDCDEAAEARLLALGFKPVIGGEVFLRSFRLGDFSASAIQLKLTIDRSSGEARLGSRIFAILVDVGNLWIVAQQIRGARPI